MSIFHWCEKQVFSVGYTSFVRRACQRRGLTRYKTPNLATWKAQLCCQFFLPGNGTILNFLEIFCGTKKISGSILCGSGAAGKRGPWLCPSSLAAGSYPSICFVRNFSSIRRLLEDPMFKAVRSPKAWNVRSPIRFMGATMVLRNKVQILSFTIPFTWIGTFGPQYTQQKYAEVIITVSPEMMHHPKKPQEKLHWSMDASQSSRSFSIQSRSVLGWDGYGHQLQGKIRHELRSC